MKKPTLRQQVAELREERVALLAKLEELRANLRQLADTLARVAGPSGSAILSVIHSRCERGPRSVVLSLHCDALCLERDADGMPTLSSVSGLGGHTSATVDAALLQAAEEPGSILKHAIERLGANFGRHVTETLFHVREG